jgi:hypothetical protein
MQRSQKYPPGLKVYVEGLTCANGTTIDLTSNRSTVDAPRVTAEPFACLRLDSSVWQTTAGPGCSAAHLDRRQVKKLRDALDAFLREHRHLSLV